MSEVKLLPCPFCGSDVNGDNSGHAESCYFTTQENFENSCGGDITVVLDAWNKRPDFDAQRLRADTAEAERDSLRAALTELLDCPYVIEEATIPSGGIEAAPNQVVGTMHIALARIRKLRAALNPNPEAESHE